MLPKHRYGWLRDYPDHRDFTPECSYKLLNGQKICDVLLKMGLESKDDITLPTTIDLRRYCSDVKNQGHLGSCTSHAGVALLEFFENKSFSTYIEASRLFLYKISRKLIGFNDDVGSYIRTTMGAMRMFGIPPEKFLPYYVDGQINPDWNKDPEPFLYAYASNYKAIEYFRLDAENLDKNKLLLRIKTYLYGSYPSMFGFTVYDSIKQASDSGFIPYPDINERVVGGHAVVAIGYDDDMKVVNTANNEVTKGAILIQNSWGQGWGEHGYGWLPYKYILSGLAVDWWTLIQSKWINTNNFGF
ncbi:C1 family peptidase [Fastidiosibacter lacustris]|uniref:C1 family peptidase n=1 Tax=Fastidiosibacter lacustris TaxID=2056695 RepID=UPI000E352B1C|nr:C1 family peptidase [Fastidiosibacter lacustris]